MQPLVRSLGRPPSAAKLRPRSAEAAARLVGGTAGMCASAASAPVRRRRVRGPVIPRGGRGPALGSASPFVTLSSQSYRAFLLDMDGVLHQFGKGVPGASEFLEALMRDSIPFMVITNECRYTREGLSAKLASILNVTVPTSQIYTAANSVEDFIKHHIRRGWVGNVFVIGEQGLVDAVDAALQESPGSRVVTASSTDKDISEDLHCDFVCVGTVVTGGKSDSWTGAEQACKHLRNGAKLLYSNPDWFEVTASDEYKFGCPMPIVNLLTQVTGCKAYNLGKPNPFMLRGARKQLVDSILRPLSDTQRSFVRGQIDAKDVLFVGDSIDTDLRMAVENGIDAALVLSGTSCLDALSRCAIQPEFVFDSVRHLHDALQQGRVLRGAPNFCVQSGKRSPTE